MNTNQRLNQEERYYLNKQNKWIVKNHETSQYHMLTRGISENYKKKVKTYHDLAREGCKD